MANTTNRTTRIKHVYGNVLKLAIPLTLRTVTLEGGTVEVSDTDYTPSNRYPVVVQFVNGPLKYELDATIRDNYIAVVEDKGTIPVGTYAIVVLCRDNNGDPRRFKQRCVVEVVDVTADAGIEIGVEFESQEWLLEGAIFLAVKGEDGLDGVGIESITTDETSISGEYNQVTFHLTNGTSYTLNVRNGESTEQTLPANVVIDERYVHTDNNYTNADKQKVSNIDKLFGDVVYDRIARRLNFFNINDTTHTKPLKSIDITDFVRDGRVSSFRIIDGNLTIKLNSDGGNEEFKVPISRIANLANYYTKGQIDTKIPLAVYVTKNGNNYSSSTTFANLHYALSENYRNAVAITSGGIVYQLSFHDSDVILFSNVNFEEHSQSLLTVDDSGWHEETHVIESGGSSTTQVQSDWNVTDTANPAFIKNKPTIPAAYDDTALSGRVSALENAGYITSETDPTVPSWAKQPTKPSYTASEVGAVPTTRTINNKALSSNVTLTPSDIGALPASTTIPTKTSDLTNDSGFTTNIGTVTSITVNNQTVTPDPLGNINLGTIQGETGAQGPKGDTVVVSTEGLEQFDLANELDSSSTTDGLTARQGRILKQAINTLRTDLQTLINSLASMAFVNLPKPTLTTIDWTGGTFYATIAKSLTGCTATDNTTNGQIVEGSTLTVTLTASSGYTLAGATISVTNSKGQSVAYTLSNNVMTISNVVGTINISVVAVAVASVTNSDSHVDLTSQTLAPVIGSSWTGTLAIKSGVSNYRIAPSPTITMGGDSVDFTTSGNSWDSTTGVIVIGNVTGDIVIVSASIEVVAVKVRNHFINVNSSNSASQVEQGDAYNTILSPITDATSNNDLRVFIGGELMTADTDYTFDSTTGALSIPAAKITGDIDVCATAYTGKITITVKAGTSTTVKMARDQWAANFYDDTIDASESAEDVTVVIDNVPIYNSKPTVSIITIGTKSAIKAIDFGGCSTRNGGNKFSMYNYTDLESFSGLAYIETPNNASVTLGGYFYGCSSLQHDLDLMSWRCDTINNVNDMLRGVNVDKVTLPYLPNLTSTAGILRNSRVKKLIFNKTGIITSFREMFAYSPNIEFVDMSLATVQLVAGTYTWYFTTSNDTKSGFTLKIGDFDVSGAPNSGGLSKVGKLICTTTTPPHSELLNCLSSSVLIYVPNSAVDTYKQAWPTFASNIYSINDYTEE